MSKTILIVDDDKLLRRSLAFKLEQAGYRAQTAASAEDALGVLHSQAPDLILLDVGLPGVDGLEALRHVRNKVGDVPIIFVTARRRELDEVLGLELGADDYITKPFDPDVLLARIRAVLRRTTQASAQSAVPEMLVVGDLVINRAQHRVAIQGDPISLPPREFNLLYALAQEPDTVVPSEELLVRVWGEAFAGEPQVVYVHVRRLREKLEDDPQNPRRLLTIRGVGYKLVPQET